MPVFKNISEFLLPKEVGLQELEENTNLYLNFTTNALKVTAMIGQLTQEGNEAAARTFYGQALGTIPGFGEEAIELVPKLPPFTEINAESAKTAYFPNVDPNCAAHVNFGGRGKTGPFIPLLGIEQLVDKLHTESQRRIDNGENFTRLSLQEDVIRGYSNSKPQIKCLFKPPPKPLRKSNIRASDSIRETHRSDYTNNTFSKRLLLGNGASEGLRAFGNAQQLSSAFIFPSDMTAGQLELAKQVMADRAAERAAQERNQAAQERKEAGDKIDVLHSDIRKKDDDRIAALERELAEKNQALAKKEAEKEQALQQGNAAVLKKVAEVQEAVQGGGHTQPLAATLDPATEAELKASFSAILKSSNAILESSNATQSAVKSIHHDVRTAVKAPRPQAHGNGPTSPKSLFPVASAVPGVPSLLSLLHSVAKATEPGSKQEKDICELLIVADSARHAAEILEGNSPDGSLLPDSVPMALTDPATINIIRHVLRKSQSPFADLKTSVGVVPVGSVGNKFAFITASVGGNASVDDSSWMDAVDMDDDAFLPAKLDSSGEHWRNHGHKAFGFFKNYQVTWTFQDSHQVILEIAAEHESHALEIISDIVGSLLGGDKNIRLGQDLLHIKFECGQGQHGGPPELPLTPSAVKTLVNFGRNTVLEFNKLTLSSDQQGAIAFSCVSKLVFNNSVLVGGGTNIRPLSGPPLDLQFNILPTNKKAMGTTMTQADVPWDEGQVGGVKFQRKGDKYAIWVENGKGGKYCHNCSNKNYKGNGGACCKSHGEEISRIKKALGEE